MKKKLLRKQIKLMSVEYDLLLSEAREHRYSAQEWRKKYELSQTSPEVKADTEAAFVRGEEHKERQMKAFLISEMQAIIDKLSE